MSKQDNYIFSPIMGEEDKVLNAQSNIGNLYFTTDTGKIYLDTEDKQKLAIGGNVNLFYGQKDPPEFVDDEETEFDFDIDSDFIPSLNKSKNAIPGVNDLILNKDGCFYKVTEKVRNKLITEKLTIAGTGGGSGNLPSVAGGNELTLSPLFYNNGDTIVQGEECKVSFAVRATDEDGDLIFNNGNSIATYTLVVNNSKKATGSVIGTQASKELVKSGIENIDPKEINTIDLTPYLDNRETNYIQIFISCDKNSRNKEFDGWIHSIKLELKLKDFNGQTAQLWQDEKSFMTLSWIANKTSIEKKVHIILDNNRDDENYHLVIPMSGREEVGQTTINFSDKNLTHGIHKFEMYLTGLLNEKETPPTPSIIHNFMVAEKDNTTPIINCELFNTNLTQYDTINIPLSYYVLGSQKLDVMLKEIINGEERLVKKWEAAPINEWLPCYYTPVNTNIDSLYISAGSANLNINVQIQSTSMDVKEVPNYKFKFKSTDFIDNDQVKNWSSNGVTATFTGFGDDNESHFDWTNGGYKIDENEQPYLRIKAGSQMKINYNPWGTDATESGKCLKIIFKVTNCKKYDAQFLNCSYVNPDRIADQFGLIMNAQAATFYAKGVNIVNQYCEDYLIEFEIDITEEDDDKVLNPKNYITSWIDGIPSGVVRYGGTLSLNTSEVDSIIIGSNDCDVQLYMIKFYERHLTNEEHLSNFIMDALNSQEMIARFVRNDILDTTTGDISYTKLAKNNPNCKVHVYEIPYMTTGKEDQDVVTGCTYRQYQGSDKPVLVSVEGGVSIVGQGTSSVAYGVSGYNIDTKFEEGFTADETNTQSKDSPDYLKKWAMTENSIPVNYFNTKINVASCEGTNNAVNAKWYNDYQPYKTAVKLENPKARDCMEFQPGVVFIKDNNKNINSSNFKDNNIFKGFDSDNPNAVPDYPKMYAIGCMGNSKKNREVFHAEGELCVEVKDNQQPGQWMTALYGTYKKNDTTYYEKIDSIRENDLYTCQDGNMRSGWTLWVNACSGGLYEFRYPKNPSPEDMKKWYRFVDWMIKSNPQPKYQEISFGTEDKYFEITFNDENEFEKAVENGNIFIYNDGRPEQINSSSNYNSANKYFKKYSPKEMYDNEVYGKTYSYNNEERERIIYNDPMEQDYNPSQRYFIETNNEYGYTNEKLAKETSYGTYTFTGYAKETTEDYKGILQGFEMDRGIQHTHDTKEYRIDKMVQECENYLNMESVIYHYLFIERHCMIDNVAKNTFWSTEDGEVWNLTKNYDNDTSDGNDNQGKLTLSYGYEPGDVNEKGISIFNAPNSVWLNFIENLYAPCEKVYGEVTKDAWSSSKYLAEHNKWQSSIPERCWIEDFYRKYFRPYEVYGETSYFAKLEGGQKKYQRAQFEKYQENYINSKYTVGTSIGVRGNKAQNLSNVFIPISLYSDGYVKAAFGNGNEPNFRERVKRGEKINVKNPMNEDTDATIYIYPSSMVQEAGDQYTGFNVFHSKTFEAQGASKLRVLSIGARSSDGTPNESSIDEIGISEGGSLLEEFYATDLVNYKGQMNQTSTMLSLQTLDVRGTPITSLTLPSGAPLKTIKINTRALDTLIASNLTKVETFITETGEDNNTFTEEQFIFPDLKTLDLNNIDQSKITSLDIVNASPLLENYKLTNINWTIDGTKIKNNEIGILDDLLDLNPYGVDNEADALTGTITITGVLGEHSTALEIYTKYVIESGYSNLNIEFTNSPLYTVNIYGGNGSVVWTKKTESIKKIDASFLSSGPNGAFNIELIEKSSDSQYHYTFSKTWTFYDDEGKSLTTLTNSDAPIVNLTIDKNIHIYPSFTSSLRNYSVTIYTPDDEIAYSSDSINYGTSIGAILDTAIKDNPIVEFPYKNDTALTNVAEGYIFKGYGTSKNSKSVVNKQTLHTKNLELWPIFEYYSDLRTVKDDHWNQYFNINEVNGKCTPKKTTIGGKIVIPEKAKIISDFNKCVNLTHVLLHENNDLTTISSKCFTQVRNLNYFDFIKATNVTTIANNAFQHTGLLGDIDLSKMIKLETLEEFAFGAIGYVDDKKVDLRILHLPTSVVTNTNGLDNRSPMISYMFQNATSKQLIIGSENDLIIDGQWIKTWLDQVNNKKKYPIAWNSGFHFDSIFIYTNLVDSTSLVEDVKSYFTRYNMSSNAIVTVTARK